MIYEYACKFCERTYDVVKPVNRLDIDEQCPLCWSEMKRLFSFRGNMTFGTFKPGHYHAFGKTFTQKHQLDNEIRKIAGETGKEMVEVGNSTKGFDKPTPQKPNVKAAVQELRRVWPK